MRSHIAVGALALAALAFITQASIAAVFTVARQYAVEWRWASALLPSALLPTEHTEVITRHAADTTPTHLATRNCR
jgi:hypothetical protein